MHYIIIIIASMPLAVVDTNISVKWCTPLPMLVKHAGPLLVNSLLVNSLLVMSLLIKPLLVNFIKQLRCFTWYFRIVCFEDLLIYVLKVLEVTEHHQAQTL